MKMIVWSDMLNQYHNGGNENYQVQYGGVPGKTMDAINMIPNDIIIMIWWQSLDNINAASYFKGKGFNYIMTLEKEELKDEWLSQCNDNLCKGVISVNWKGWDDRLMINAADAGWR